MVKVEKDQAKICGWTMAEGVLHDGQVYLYAENQVDSRSIAGSNSKNDWRIIGGSNFGVDSQGNLYAENGHFRGVINSTEGNIGGWTINQNTLSGGGVTLDASTGTIRGAFISGGHLKIGNNFTVDENGNLTASNGHFRGVINSTEGNIGGWTINQNTLSGGGVTLDASTGTITGATIKGGSIEGESLTINGKKLG